MTDVADSGSSLDLVPERYEIVGKLGEGGMGEVYRARDLPLARDVAIKLISHGMTDNPQRVQRFQLEARAAAALEHPNLLTIHDVGEHNGRQFIVTELLEGLTLREELINLDASRALNYAVQIADGLSAAHARGIVHRDLKPENIFITREGRAKILDFGLARVSSEEKAHEDQDTTETAELRTSDGVVVGTSGYMAPEQVRGKRADRRADVFVFGCVLYEMLTNRHPFRRGSPAETMSAILRDIPVSVAEIAPHVNPELSAVVDRCLEKRPEDRYDSTRDLHLTLEAINRSDSSGSGSGATRRRSGSWTARALPRGWLLGFVTAVAIIAVVGWWWGNRMGDDDAIPPLQPKRITSFPGAKTGPEISPDGIDVAYSQQDGAGSDIWLMDLRGGNPLQLTDEGALDHSPSWFPDGSTLAFARTSGTSSDIHRIPRLGGGSVLLVADADYPAISPDGQHIAFARSDDGGFYRIWVAPIDDVEQARQLTDDDAGLWSHIHPAWSPDGSMICYQDFRNLWLVPVDGGSPQPFTRDDAPDGEPEWSPDGRFIYYASSREGVSSIWRRSVGDGVMERVTHGTGPDESPSLSADGHSLVYSRRDASYSITFYDTETGERTGLHQTVYMLGPTLAPDGSAVVFTSTREDSVDLWMVPLSGNQPASNPQRLTRQPGSCANPKYSPDGEWIAYHGVIDGQRDIWVVPATGGTPRVLEEHPAVDIQPEWSPDETRIAMSSDRSGSLEIWVAEVEGDRLIGPMRQITDTKGASSNHCWSPDSTQFAFVELTAESSDVYIVDSEGAGEPRRLTYGASATDTGWNHATGNLLVIGLWDELSYHIRAIDPVTGKPNQGFRLGPLSESAAMASLDVSIDGRLIVWAEEEDHGDLWVLEGDVRGSDHP